MTAARARLCPSSRRQAGLALIGGKRGEGQDLLLWRAAMCLRYWKWRVYTVAAGDSTVAAVVRKLQIDQIVEERLWAYNLGHVNISTLSTRSRGQIECFCLGFVCLRVKPEFVCVCVCV